MTSLTSKLYRGGPETAASAGSNDTQVTTETRKAQKGKKREDIREELGERMCGIML